MFVKFDIEKCREMCYNIYVCIITLYFYIYGSRYAFF